MTVNEAIEELKYDCNELDKAIPCDTGWGIAINEAYKMAVSALQEIQQYHTIGTVTECRENKKFLEFLYDVINPNEMEKYMSMYHAGNEKSDRSDDN